MPGFIRLPKPLLRPSAVTHEAKLYYNLALVEEEMVIKNKPLPCFKNNRTETNYWQAYFCSWSNLRFTGQSKAANNYRYIGKY